MQVITRGIPEMLTELGRIRLGHLVENKGKPGAHPEKLTHFRLTSSNKPLLEYTARHPSIGGEVEEWPDAPGNGKQWQLYTQTDFLDVGIPTFSAASLSFEEWSSGGCKRRCTGKMITHCPLQPNLVGEACACPVDDAERAPGSVDAYGALDEPRLACHCPAHAQSRRRILCAVGLRVARARGILEIRIITHGTHLSRHRLRQRGSTTARVLKRLGLDTAAMVSLPHHRTKRRSKHVR